MDAGNVQRRDVMFVINDRNEWDNGGSWSNTLKIWHVSASA